MKLKKIRRIGARFISGLYDKPLGPPAERENELVEELRATFRGLTSSEATNYSAAEKEWLTNVNRLRELVLSDNPREFLRWDVITRTMSVNNAEYVAPELEYLKGLVDWQSRWSDAILEKPAGHPLPYWRYPKSSGNLIHHAYHIAQFQHKTGLDISDMRTIFEFGGGYGNMCRLIHNLGFKGKYVLFDLPALSALQQFFLKCTGAKVLTPAEVKTVQSGITCVSKLDELKNILAGNSNANESMFIATWSISETPIGLRQLVLPLVHSYKAFLIAYQSQFREVNNVDFFKNWSFAQSSIEWYDWKIEQIPHHSRYLIGRRET